MESSLFLIFYIFALVCIGINAELSNEEKNTLLQLHKEARDALHAPDMNEISWDDTIAKGAQEYSDKCLGMVHSSYKGGENLAGSTSNEVVGMFNLWMSEKEAFDESGYRAKLVDINYNGRAIGHYSQIVWAANTKIGCGLTNCNNLYYRNLLVCRYETGNYINQQVYSDPSDTSFDSNQQIYNNPYGAINDPYYYSGGICNLRYQKIIFNISFIVILFILF